MKKNRLLFIPLLLLCAGLASAQSAPSPHYNLDLESLDAKHQPEGWSFAFSSGNNGYISRMDSTTVLQGKYSVFITKSDTAVLGTFGVCSYMIPAHFDGKMIRLSGYLKTKEVKGGYAGLWMRVDDVMHNGVGFDNMGRNGVTGTTDWTPYTIEFPYESKRAAAIVVGSLLTGSGQMWMDSLKVTIDGQPLDKVPELKQVLTAADKDTVFNKGSGIQQIKLDPLKRKQLATLGQVWGFIKYYHHAVARGDFNMDAELFRILPLLEATTTEQQGYAVIETWVDHFGQVPDCKDCTPPAGKEIKLETDYGDLFKKDALPASLQQKLSRIRDNYKMTDEHYYIGLEPQVGNPVFRKEYNYPDAAYPDDGLRLLALYRYWNMIQYFFPDRHLISGGWKSILGDFLPDFIQAADEKEYTLACLKLIARIGDTHANVWGSKVLDGIKGNYMSPFKAEFIEDKLVVTGYYSNDEALRKQLRPGAIISKINGTDVEQLVKQYLPLTAASNYETQLRDLPAANGFLLRTNKEQVKITVDDGRQKPMELEFNTLPISKVNRNLDWGSYNGDKAYTRLDDNIGYVYPAKLKDEDIGEIRAALSDTRGLIIDLRCYPTSFMPFDYGAWFKAGPSPFVRFSVIDMSRPGTFRYTDALSNGEANKHSYLGKVVLLVNAITQSQAEYTVLALSTGKNVEVIGSTTAGADGNVSQIVLPGNIHTMISGIGILYPDGSETQRVGVKISKQVKPTIKGVREGRDELLEAARKAILN